MVVVPAEAPVTVNCTEVCPAGIEGAAGTTLTVGLEEVSVKLIAVGSIGLMVAVNVAVCPTPISGEGGASVIVGVGNTV